MEPMEPSNPLRSSQDDHTPSEALASDPSSPVVTLSCSIGRRPKKLKSRHKHGHQPSSKTDSSADMNLTANQEQTEDKDVEASHHHNPSSPSPPAINDTSGNRGGGENTHTQQTQNATPNLPANNHRPRIRDHIPICNMDAVVIANGILNIVHGYDVGNVANIQPSIYKAFGGMVFLPWLALGYSVSIIAFIPLARKFLRTRHYKMLSLISILASIGGAAISGSASHFVFLVIGRVLTAWGASFTHQGMTSHDIILCTPHRLFVVSAYMGACFATGLVVGPIVGGVFAGTGQISWRWAIAAWAAFTLIVFVYVIQQAYSIGTTPDERIISPFSLLNNRTVMLSWTCTFCAAAAYGATLYYVPIYFAFHQGLSPLDVATRLLPLICIFISTVGLSSALLASFHIYKPFFIIGSGFLIISGGLFQTLSTRTPQSSMMTFESLVAVGVGMLWHLAVPVCSTFLRDTKDRLDLALLSKIAQLGGIAMALSLAAVIYQSTGFRSLKESLGNGDMGSFSDEDIFEMLAGVDSPIIKSSNSAEIQPLVMGAITDAIRGCFTIILAAGCLSFIAALCMKWENMDEQKSESLGLRPPSGQRNEGSIVLDGLTVTGDATGDSQAPHNSAGTQG
ncbi:major facilitator superfamily domain-containing protein [Annulohypoxylon moriforme]|nr:major facilitator superfamily domain-containing protein [Annulohypoxylon moriforme]